MQYKIPAGGIQIGHKVDLQSRGFEDPMIVFKVYEGRPHTQDTLIGRYDLSKLDVSDDWRQNGEEENYEGITLIIAPASGSKGTVIYMNDTQEEVSVIDDDDSEDF